MKEIFRLTAAEIAEGVGAGRMKAVDAVESCLARIAATDRRVNAFTSVLADRARARAAGIDARIARGESVGPLAGAPFCVKNLFDVEESPPSPDRRSIPRMRAPRVTPSSCAAWRKQARS